MGGYGEGFKLLGGPRARMTMKRERKEKKQVGVGDIIGRRRTLK